MATPTLPDDIIVEEILTRLPLKSVLCFRSVCKLWNSLFSEPSYIRSVLNFSIFKNSDDQDCLILCVRESFLDLYRTRLSILSCSTLSEIHIDDVPYLVSSNDGSEDSIDIVGSINGLVCLACFSSIDTCFILWNPALRLFRKIIPNRHVASYLRYPKLCMLGYSWDPVKNDYKLILAHPSYTSSAFVYSCKTDCWSKIFVPTLTSSISGDSFWFPSAIVKGISYWKSIVTCCNILKFEARNDQLTYIDTPRVLGTYRLVNLNDCLARISYSWDGSGPVDVHTLDEESGLWSKIYTFNTALTNFQNFLTCFKSGAVIIACDGKYQLYDFMSNEIKSFNCDHGTEGLALRGFSYTPTLVVLAGMKPLHL